MLRYLVSVMIGQVLVVQMCVRPVIGGGEFPGALGANRARLPFFFLAPAAASHARVHIHAHTAVQQRLNKILSVYQRFLLSF